MNKAKVVLPVAQAMKHLQYEFISMESFDQGNCTFYKTTGVTRYSKIFKSSSYLVQNHEFRNLSFMLPLKGKKTVGFGYEHFFFFPVFQHIPNTLLLSCLMF